MTVELELDGQEHRTTGVHHPGRAAAYPGPVRRLVGLFVSATLLTGCAATTSSGTVTRAVAGSIAPVTTAPSTTETTDASNGGTLVTADPARTPGVPDPSVTQDNIAITICVSGYTAKVRPSSSFTTKLKIAQLAADPRYIDHDPKHYEEDHAISLELGGAPSDPLNLWPEAHVRSGKVDADENRLHAAVCAGATTLAAAQVEIMRIKATVG